MQLGQVTISREVFSNHSDQVAPIAQLDGQRAITGLLTRGSQVRVLPGAPLFRVPTDKKTDNR
jgi:hypothetical protein